MTTIKTKSMKNMTFDEKFDKKQKKTFKRESKKQNMILLLVVSITINELKNFTKLS